MFSSGWLFLAAMVLAYGVANLLQAIAAGRVRSQSDLHPRLLLRLCAQRTYLLGVGCQLLGFVLAFLARRALPLFLVQASMAAGLGVTALLGVLLLGWRLPRAELVLLAALGLGVAALLLSARPAPARQVGPAAVVTLTAALVGIGLCGVFAAKLAGATGSVSLGVLAGLAFGAAAVASRPLASQWNWSRLAVDPLVYLLVAHVVVGQLLLGLAMQRGSVTAAVAAMDAASAVPAAVIGLALLGDQIWPGREWLAGLGFVVTLTAVAGLTRYARPQPGRRQPVAPVVPPPAPRIPSAEAT